MHGLNLYDYSARQYDPAIGQFTSMDPLCEKYYHISPYVYCAGNPVKYVDPDGRDAVSIIDEENKTLTIKANYYVVTDNNKSTCAGYSSDEIKNMTKMVSDINKNGYVISEGNLKGYKVFFDLQFIDGGNLSESNGKMINDYYETSDGSISYGNVMARNDASNDSKLCDKSPDTHVGGYAQGNYIVMNAGSDINGDKLDTNRNRLHEIFHTFGYDDAPGSKGIMDYKVLKISQNDINKLYDNIKMMNK